MSNIILASGSPRRRELLAQIGFDFVVEKSDVCEVVPDNIPVEYVPVELARQKAQDVCQKHAGEDIIVIGADTIVSIDGNILGKPKNEEDAFAMLSRLSGRGHSVYTGVVLGFFENENIKFLEFFSETKVYVNDITDEEIRNYIATKDPMDKAGAYGIQGVFARHIDRIEGDYFNVVGLPVSKVYENIKKILKK